MYGKLSRERPKKRMSHQIRDTIDSSNSESDEGYFNMDPSDIKKQAIEKVHLTHNKSKIKRQLTNTSVNTDDGELNNQKIDLIKQIRMRDSMKIGKLLEM